MRIKEGFILRKLGAEYVAVAMGQARKDFNGLVRMNETGKFLWESLKEEKTRAELLEALMAEYDADRNTVAEDLDEFLELLKGAGLLV